MKKSKLQQSIAAFNIVGIALLLSLSACSAVQTPATPSPGINIIRTATTAPTSTAAPVPQNLLESQMESARQAGYLHASYSNAVGGTVLTAAELDTTPFKDGGIIPLSPDGKELGRLDGETIAIPHLDALFYRSPDIGELAVYTFYNSDERWIYYTNPSGPVLKVPVSLPAGLADLVGVYSVSDRDPALVAAKLMQDGTIQITPIVFTGDEDISFSSSHILIDGKETVYNTLTGVFEEIPSMPYEIQNGWIYERNQAGDLFEAKIYYNQFPYINVSEIRDTGNGTFEAYDAKGRLMFVRPGIEMSVGKKTIGANEWVFAPFGIALIDGFWKEWGVDENGKYAFIGGIVENQQKFGNPANIQVIVDFVNNELRTEYKPGIMQPLSPALTNNMEVVPGKEEEIYGQYLDAFASAIHPGIRKYLKDAFGYTGGGLEEFMKAIDKSLGPNGEKRWFPMTAPNGTPYMDAQGNQNWNADIKSRSYPKDGIIIDGMYFVFVGLDGWQNNPLAKAWLSDVLLKNKNERNSFFSHVAIGVSDYFVMWGIQFDPKTHRPLFVVINPDDITSSNQEVEHYTFYRDGFKKAKLEDEPMTTSFWDIYLYVFSKMGTKVIRESMGRLCNEPNMASGCRPVVTYDSIPSDGVLFKYPDDK